MKLLYRLSNLLFPPKCTLCRELLNETETDLCHRCRCEISEQPRTGIKLPYIADWTALWYYEGAVRNSLLRFKFHNARSYAQVYGRHLAMKLLSDQVEYDLLTWVPISPWRKWRRGYDQVALIAEAVGKELETPPVPLLKKIRNNPPQSGFSNAARRRANVLGVYKVLDPAQIRNKRILLLDDIITTGATAGECARILLTAGAKEVHCAAVAVAHHQPNNQ